MPSPRRFLCWFADVVAVVAFLDALLTVAAVGVAWAQIRSSSALGFRWPVLALYALQIAAELVFVAWRVDHYRKGACRA